VKGKLEPEGLSELPLRRARKIDFKELTAYIRGGVMRALKTVKIRYADREVECLTLFDTGSGITAIQRAFFEEHFGTSWLKLEKPRRVYWINGEYIEIDKYAHIIIIIDGLDFPEVVFIIDSYVREIEVEGRSIRLPELIIGSGTMDKYGIALDPKEGVKLGRAVLLV